MAVTKDVVRIRIRRDTLANLLAGERDSGITKYQGEPYYTTDTKQLFIHDGTVVQPVQSLDMACINDGDVVTNEGEIVYAY